MEKCKNSQPQVIKPSLHQVSLISWWNSSYLSILRLNSYLCLLSQKFSTASGTNWSSHKLLQNKNFLEVFTPTHIIKIHSCRRKSSKVVRTPTGPLEILFFNYNTKASSKFMIHFLTCILTDMPEIEVNIMTHACTLGMLWLV